MNTDARVRERRMPRPRRAWLGLLLMSCLSTYAAHAGSAKPKELDLGPLAEQPGAARMSVTLALRMRAGDEAERLMASLHTPGDPQYGHFLTAAQFEARFAPDAADVARVTAALARYGLSAERTSALTLRVSGSPSAMERAFAVNLHAYHVPAHGNERAYDFHAPLSRGVIPAEVAGSVSVVLGLDSRPSLRPKLMRSLHTLERPAAAPRAGGNPPGSLTVTDFASRYDVQPLYNAGVTGKGRTLGIVTFANFTPSDAFAYWNAVGLNVDKDRLRIVNVDGGPGAPSDDSGSLETSIDVEQSGGLAPDAHIIVYMAPNTNQSFLDAFVQAVHEDRAQSLSVSWGFWEWFQNLENSPVTDPVTGQTTGLYQAVHEQFVRAAIQGQSLFAASGDSGAYDANGDVGCFAPYSPDTFSCTQPLTVDYPASDPAVTAGGGTTLPAQMEFCLNSACTPPFYEVNIRNERVWGWDYLVGLCQALGVDPISCGIFPVGGGGGVSVFFSRPGYQSSIQGVRRSEHDQVWQSSAAVAASIGITATYFALPGGYAGRNLPDVSFNADPETGYVVAYTSDHTGFSFQTGWGGTSFVAPQLNGLTALFGQRHGRLGLLNYPMYRLAQDHRGYGGKHKPLQPVEDGTNWFYHGSNGYNPAAGLGTMDVANFEATLPGRRDE